MTCLSFTSAAAGTASKSEEISLPPTTLGIRSWAGGDLRSDLRISNIQNQAVSFEIDRRLIVLIRSAGPSIVEFVLKLPSPFSVSHKTFGQDLEFVFSWDDKTGVWRISGKKLPWLNAKVPSKIGGDINQWLQEDSTVDLDFLNPQSGPIAYPPIVDLGLCTQDPEFTKCNIAFVLSNSLTTVTSPGTPDLTLNCVWIPHRPLPKIRPYPGFLNLAGVNDIPLSTSQPVQARLAPFVFTRSLAPGRQKMGPDPTWLAIVQWRPQGEGKVPLGLSSITADAILTRVWNRAIAFALGGARMPQASAPWLSLPLREAITDGEASRAIFVFQLRSRNQTAELRRILFYNGRAADKPYEVKTPKIGFIFPWQSGATVVAGALDPHGYLAINPPAAISQSQLTINGSLVGATWGFGWDDLKKTDQNGQITIDTLKNLLWGTERFSDDAALDDRLAVWKIDAAGTKETKWFAVGALEFQIQEEKCLPLELVLRGAWNAERCDIFPELYLKDVSCKVRLASGSDPSRERQQAMFDTLSRVERDLQEETGPVIGNVMQLGSEDAGVVVNGLLSIRVRCEPGRNAVTEWRVKRDSSKSSPSSNFYFQARPFAIARIDTPTIDPEAGYDFAYWRSDDPEGPQWRVADSKIEMDLQPQSVAEEMERGNRFWPVDSNTPYVDIKRPLRFRFSPPTRLCVRPSLDVRRYHPIPNNLGQILRHAKVESFTTELVHPVRIGFSTDGEGLPDIRISESGTFFGHPTANLPPSGESIVELAREVLSAEFADWLNFQGGQTKRDLLTDFEARYKILRARQSAMRATFVARLGKYHLYDPYRRDKGLGLHEGLNFSLRDTGAGAPPLINPLPRGSDVSPEIKAGAAFKKFLDGQDWVSNTGAQNTGSIRAGVIHTMEFASELGAVLGTPVSSEGNIEKLAFSALGASGSMSVSFDEGRTTFVAEFAEGQLSRLKKIRIGRIGVVWNRAIHVIVYDRTVAPAEQFFDEQKQNPMLQWPVLRKTEEYVEPTEPIRPFSTEKATAENPPGFVDASEFVTPRIYVNGAWGRDLGHGYEIPLWNRYDSSGFYPKPNVALRLHAGGDQTSRAWHDCPEELYFYTNTEKGTGRDTDAWAPQPGVDLSDVGPMRLNVAMTLDRSPVEMDTVPSPSPDSGRRPRFDFKVTCDGQANLQQFRGDTPMLAPLHVITLARTEETAPRALEAYPEKAKNELKRVQGLTNRGASLDQVHEEIETFLRKLPGQFLKYYQEPTTLNARLKADTKTLFKQLRTKIVTLSGKIEGLDLAWTSIEFKLVEELTKNLALPPKLISDGAKELRAEIERERNRITLAELSILQNRLRNYWVMVYGLVKQTQDTIRSSWDKGAIDALTVAAKDCDALATNIEKIPKLPPVDIRKELEGIRQATRDFRAKIARVKAPRVQTVLSRIDNLACLVESIADEAAQTSLDTVVENLLAPLKLSFDPIATALRLIANELLDISTRISPANLGKLLANALTKAASIEKLLERQWLAVDEAKQVMGEVSSLLGTEVNAAEDSLVGNYGKWAQDVTTIAADKSAQLNNGLKTISGGMATAVSAYRNAFQGAANGALQWLIDQETSVNAAIDTIADNSSAALADVRNRIEQQLQDARADVEAKVTSVAKTIVNNLANSPELEALKQFSDRGSKALKLVKAMGDLPELPHLSFNASRAEYVFDDLKKQIDTSPFAVRLREIDGGLKELGLAVPTRQLLDQFVPDALPVDFNKIYRNLGGLELEGMLKKFRLPSLSGDEVNITHGVDRATRSAWVKTRLQADYHEAKSLFEIGSLEVKVSELALRGSSDITIGLDGSRRSVTESEIKGDWALILGGTSLVTFRQVAVRFDGHNFKFTVSPDKVEMHPSLRFITEIGKKIGEKIPPAVTILRDDRGLPTGVAANLTTIVRDPPPLGPVQLGSFAIAAGLGLEVDPKGKFALSTHVSLGTREMPLFLQIGFLGGGLWLTAKAKYIVGEKGLTCSADLGLAVGSVRALSLGGIARGSYSILLFAYATFDDKGGSFRAGLSMDAHARILGMCSAHVSLLLEVTHSQEGDSNGCGVLDVEVEICWCYTLRVHREVEQKL